MKSKNGCQLICLWMATKILGVVSNSRRCREWAEGSKPICYIQEFLNYQSSAMTTTKMRRFYFQIPAANVIECIWAHSLTDAKAKAAIDWMPWWQQIEWLNPEHVTDPSIHV
jgi:hypothetical protein